mgnify:CR=1 FL=1
MHILIEVILPIVLVVGAGTAIGRTMRLDATLLSRIILYLLGPALIFRSLVESTVALEDVLRITVFVVLIQVLLWLVSRGIGRVAAWDDDTRAAGSLVLTFSNCGNYGLAVLLFAYGEAAFTLGVVYMLASILMQATLGVGVGSWRHGMSWRAWIAQVGRVPWLYAFVLSLVVYVAGWQVPTGIYRAIDLLASAAIPAQLILLGIQLARVPLHAIAGEAIVLTALKLTLPPLLAWGLTVLLGVGGLTQAVLILEASMPSAINAMILSMHFGRRPELAATVVFLTTVLSVGSITLLLSVLN